MVKTGKAREQVRRISKIGSAVAKGAKFIFGRTAATQAKRKAGIAKIKDGLKAARGKLHDLNTKARTRSVARSTAGIQKLKKGVKKNPGLLGKLGNALRHRGVARLERKVAVTRASQKSANAANRRSKKTR